MKKIALLIITLVTVVSAFAQKIESVEDLDKISNQQHFIKVKTDHSIKTITSYNERLAQKSMDIDGAVVIIVTEVDVYDEFYYDFYVRTEYSSNRGIALNYNLAKGTYSISCYGDIYEKSGLAMDLMKQFLENNPDVDDAGFYDYFIDNIAEAVVNAPSNMLSASSNLADDNWAKYEIGQRTAQNPLVNKSFIKGNLTDTQLKLALETPYVDTAVKVYDAAGLLSDNEISKLQNRIHQFVNKYNVDMVVVTINHNNKTNMNGELPSDNYAMDFYEYNDFGKGAADIHGYDGVILLIDMQYRKFRILDRGVPNEKWGVAKSNVDKYVENMASDLTAQRYYSAINYFIGAYESDYEYEISFPWIKCSLLALILGFILLSVEKGKYKNIRKATSAANYVKEGSFRLTVNKDTFISTHTTKTYDPPQKSSGGGSHGGSSGRSFGGGSGSF